MGESLGLTDVPPYIALPCPSDPVQQRPHLIGQKIYFKVTDPTINEEMVELSQFKPEDVVVEVYTRKLWDHPILEFSYGVDDLDDRGDPNWVRFTRFMQLHARDLLRHFEGDDAAAREAAPAPLADPRPGLNTSARPAADEAAPSVRNLEDDKDVIIRNLTERLETVENEVKQLRELETAFESLNKKCESMDHKLRKLQRAKEVARWG